MLQFTACVCNEGPQLYGVLKLDNVLFQSKTKAELVEHPNEVCLGFRCFAKNFENNGCSRLIVLKFSLQLHELGKYSPYFSFKLFHLSLILIQTRSENNTELSSP